MSKRCEIYTRAGKPCPNRGKFVNSETRKVVCGTHVPVCKSLIQKYKSICDLVWTRKCSSNMTDEELLWIMDVAEKCRTHRVLFQKDCCNGTDRGHLGAIKKMEKIVKNCSAEISKRARPATPKTKL